MGCCQLAADQCPCEVKPCIAGVVNLENLPPWISEILTEPWAWFVDAVALSGLGSLAFAAHVYVTFIRARVYYQAGGAR